MLGKPYVFKQGDYNIELEYSVNLEAYTEHCKSLSYLHKKLRMFF